VVDPGIQSGDSLRHQANLSTQLFGNNVEMPLDLFYLARSHAMTLLRDSDF
jgi:hypothetical protein